MYNLNMHRRTALLEALDGEEGCRRLSADFYSRVADDAMLRRLFPGRSLRCAIDEFSAFLIQFLGGDEDQAQSRWWLSLRESHSRFRILGADRGSWLKHMSATLDAAPIQDNAREALRQFFLQSSAHVLGRDAGPVKDAELAESWRQQRLLEDAANAIASGNDAAAAQLVPQFTPRPSILIGLLAKLVQSRRPAMIRLATALAAQDATLAGHRFAGRTILHYAAGAGCIEMVTLLLQQGTNPDLQDREEHTPLYRVANECVFDTGADVVRALAGAGANIRAHTGVMRTTALHMAARRGFVEIAQALLDCGAEIDARDKRGDTPLQRALNCRKQPVADLLLSRGARSG